MDTLPSGAVTVAGAVGGNLADEEEEEEIALFLPAGVKIIRTNQIKQIKKLADFSNFSS